MSVPLVLAEPSIVCLEVRPKVRGIYLSLLPERGDAVLPCRYVSIGTPAEEVLVPGSGVYRMLLENRSLFSVCFSAKVTHLPAAGYAEQQQRSSLQESLQERRSELEQLRQQDAELARSEAELAQRLWEVQETRRRHDAMRSMLQEQLSSISEQLAACALSPEAQSLEAQLAVVRGS